MKYLKKKLTIILLLKERKDFTQRFLLFFSKLPQEYKLLIADGSKKALSKYYFEPLIKNNVDFKYCKFPYDKNLKTFVNKIYKSLLIVETEYVMLFDNDDFPVKSAIDRCIIALDKRQDLIGCGGYLLNFTLFAGKLAGNPIHLSKINYGGKYIQKKSMDRVSSFLLGKINVNTINDIFRTKILKNTYKVIKNVNFKYYYFYFLLVDILNYYKGKVLKLNIPFILHQHHPEGMSNTMKNIYETSNNIIFFSQKKKFYNFLQRKIKNKKIKKLLDKYFIIINSKSYKYKLRFSNTKKTNFLFLLKVYAKIKNKFLFYFNTHIVYFFKDFKYPFLKKEIMNILIFIKKYSLLLNQYR
jgi:glycosyltransferase domain-containing protein